MARACGHDHLAGFRLEDLTTFSRDMADLSGVSFGGAGGQVPDRLRTYSEPRPTAGSRRSREQM